MLNVMKPELMTTIASEISLLKHEVKKKNVLISACTAKFVIIS